MTGFYSERLHRDLYPQATEREVARRHQLMVKLAHEHFPILPDRVLDIGGENLGPANYLMQALGLAPDRFEWVDISAPVVAAFRGRGLHCTQADISMDRLPFEDGSFGLVVMGEVLEHLPDIDRGLQEIRRLLSKDGVLVLSTPNLCWWANRLQLLAGFQPVFTETGTRRVFGRGPFIRAGAPVGHLQVLTLRALKELLGANSFKITKLVGVPLDSQSKVGRLTGALDNLLARIPSLAAGLVVACTPVGP